MTRHTRIDRPHNRAGHLLRGGSAAAALTLAGMMLANPAAAADGDAGACDIERPIIFAGLDYDSARFHNALARMILDEGYGCATDELPGSVIPLVGGMSRGDVDVVMEIWSANPVQVWLDAREKGQVVEVGTNFPDAREAWFVPRYVVEGADAPAKDLKSVGDLPKYTKLFEDQEETDKGRFYNCPAGWQCEIVNSKKLHAYGLEDSYTNFRPGTGEALSAAVDSAVKRKKPILFYYWGPTWLLGKYDFVALEEPAFDADTWAAMMAADAPEQATAYPESTVIIGANADFAKAAPTVIGFLERYETTSEQVSRALAHIRDTEGSPEDGAKWFLAEYPDVWKAWVSPEVAERVTAAAQKG